MKVRETCSCGAQIKIRARRRDAMQQVEIWRLDHPHEPSDDEAPEQRGVSTSDFTFGFIPDHPRPSEVQL